MFWGAKFKKKPSTTKKVFIICDIRCMYQLGINTLFSKIDLINIQVRTKELV